MDFQRVAQELPERQPNFGKPGAGLINTGTRHTEPQEAQALVRQAAALCRARFGVENFYKKIDSTLRGNIAQNAWVCWMS